MIMVWHASTFPFSLVNIWDHSRSMNDLVLECSSIVLINQKLNRDLQMNSRLFDTSWYSVKWLSAMLKEQSMN